MESYQQRVKDLRSEFDLSQEELAERTGISVSTIAKWESGAVQNPGKSSIKAVADALNISFDWLKTGEGEMRTSTAHDVIRSGDNPHSKFADTERGESDYTGGVEWSGKLQEGIGINELKTQLSTLLHSRLNMSEEELLMFLTEEGGAYNLSLLTVLERVKGETIEVEYFAQIRRREKKISPPQKQEDPASDEARS